MVAYAYAAQYLDEVSKVVLMQFLVLTGEKASGTFLIDQAKLVASFNPKRRSFSLPSEAYFGHHCPLSVQPLYRPRWRLAQSKKCPASGCGSDANRGAIPRRLLGKRTCFGARKDQG
jgi:hypothetical protein